MIARDLQRLATGHKGINGLGVGREGVRDAPARKLPRRLVPRDDLVTDAQILDVRGAIGGVHRRSGGKAEVAEVGGLFSDKPDNWSAVIRCPME